MSREELVRKTIEALRKSGFTVSHFPNSNTCFDIIAKSVQGILVVKVYENVDSMRRELAEELKKLGAVLNAGTIIVGEKTKVFRLEDGVVYYRYEVPVTTLKTFEGILEEKTPLVRHFKGRNIVDIDSEKLRELRGEMGVSLEELAGRIGVATETLYRFEKGASTSLETARRLEEELKKSLVKEVRIFERKPEKIVIDESPDEEVLGKLHDLGLKMAVFSHTPFRAFGKADEGMFISTGKGKFDIPKKALELKKTSAVIGSDSLIITKEYKYKSEGGVPVVNEGELETMSRFKELKKLLREREGEK